MPDRIIPRLLAAMDGMGGYRKDNTANAGKYSYNYEDFAQVDSIVTDALREHGLAYRQSLMVADDARTALLRTRVCDMETGEEMVLDTRPLFLSSDPQANGSAETYARRYALKTAFRLAEADDDGAAAKCAPKAAKAPQNGSDGLAAAKMRLWQSIQRYAEANGRTPEEILQGAMKRPDWAETAEAYDAIAADFEGAL